ncbi:hypothetical protein BDFG_04477 [Blastomyces dermatitidis ATCC 26199]|nr:hypothetical protein BDFG_04477 [Blastomyces dermatitidis ATCC 26199]
MTMSIRDGEWDALLAGTWQPMGVDSANEHSHSALLQSALWPIIRVRSNPGQRKPEPRRPKLQAIICTVHTTPGTKNRRVDRWMTIVQYVKIPHWQSTFELEHGKA